MRRTITLFICGILATLQLNAQSGKKDYADMNFAINRMRDSVYEKPFFQRPASVGISAGTQGIGVLAKIKFKRQWAVRLGFDIIPVKYVSPLNFDGTRTTATLNTNFTNIHAFAEYMPFQSSGFRIVGGLGYFLSGSVKGNLTLKDAQKYGDLVISPADIGQIDINIDWKGIAPYLGVGFLKTIPKHRFNVNIDLGTYYLVKPKATMVGTNLLAENNRNNAQLTENISGYQWLPVLQLNFNYRLNKN